MSVTEAQLTAWESRTDEELCALVRGGVLGAEEVLVKRYTRLVRKLARPFYLARGDSDDLIQEGMIGLLHGVREYDASRPASFRTFAEICIRNRLYSAVRAAARDKRSEEHTSELQSQR